MATESDLHWVDYVPKPKRCVDYVAIIINIKVSIQILYSF